MSEQLQNKTTQSDLHILTESLVAECRVAKGIAAHAMALHREGLELLDRIGRILSSSPEKLTNALLSCQDLHRETSNQLSKLSEVMTLVAQLAIAKDLDLPGAVTEFCESAVKMAKNGHGKIVQGQLINQRFLQQDTPGIIARIPALIISATNDLARHCEQLEQFHHATVQLLSSEERMAGDHSEDGASKAWSTSIG